jgi:hypothetical protein
VACLQDVNRNFLRDHNATKQGRLQLLVAVMLGQTHG